MCLLGNALLMISAGQNVWAVKWLDEWSLGLNELGMLRWCVTDSEQNFRLVRKRVCYFRWQVLNLTSTPVSGSIRK